MELAGDEIKTMKDLERYALKRMNVEAKRLEDLNEVPGLSARQMKVGAFEAIEIIHLPDEMSLSGPTPATRSLTVLGGDYLLVVVLMHLDGGDASTPLVWDTVLSSLKVDEPLSWPARLALGGVIALALLALLLFTKRVSNEKKGLTYAVDPSAGGLSSEGWGNAPPPEDMHTETAQTLASRPPPVPAAASGSERPAPPGMARTLPRSPVPAAEVPKPEPVMASQEAPTPPGMARTLPSSPPRVPTGGPSLPPAEPSALPRVPTGGPSLPRVPTGGPSMPPQGSPQPPATPASPPPPPAGEEAPKRGGLTSTLPPSGRWSESA